MKQTTKKIAILLLISSMLLQVAGCGLNSFPAMDSSDEISENIPDESTPEEIALEKSAAEVDATLENLTKDSSYANAESAERAEKALEALSELANNNPESGEAYVDAGTIDYNEELQQITFEDAEGTLCIWPLEDEKETELAYVHAPGAANDFSSLLSANEEDVEAMFSRDLSSQTKTNNSKTKILFVTAFYDETDKSIGLMEEVKNSLNSCGVNADITVIAADLVKLRTALSKEKYSLINILCHGMKTRVNGNQTCVIRVQGTCDDYANNSKLKADKKAKRVIKVCLVDKYYLTGDFFSYYYSNNKLDNSIIHLSSCSGMGYFNYDTGKGSDFFELSNGLLAAGAKAVVGHINDVLLYYDISELYIEIAALSAGYNIFDSLFYAYHFWGTSDYVFYCQEIDSSGKKYREENNGRDATTEIRGSQKASFDGEKDNITFKTSGQSSKSEVDSIHIAMSNSDIDFEDGDFYVEAVELYDRFSYHETDDGYYFTDESNDTVLTVTYLSARTEADVVVLKPIGDFQIIANSGPSNAITEVDLAAYVTYKNGDVEVIDLKNGHLFRGETGFWYYSIALLEDGEYVEFGE